MAHTVPVCCAVGSTRSTHATQRVAGVPPPPRSLSNLVLDQVHIVLEEATANKNTLVESIRLAKVGPCSLASAPACNQGTIYLSQRGGGARNVAVPDVVGASCLAKVRAETKVWAAPVSSPEFSHPTN